jgi:hypothetical protein
MSKYKITAKRKTDCDPFHDPKGNLMWDGKPKLLTLTVGDKEVIDYIFESMKGYTDSKIWDIKKGRVS